MSPIIGRLQTVRELGGLTPSDLSRLCGLHRTYFAQVERLSTDVGVSRLVAAMIVLGTSADWLVLGRGDAPTEEQVRAAIEHAQREPSATRAAIDRVLGTGTRKAPRSRAVGVRARARRARAKVSSPRPLPGGPTLRVAAEGCP